jgi:hypothetical protein
MAYRTEKRRVLGRGNVERKETKERTENNHGL